MSDKHSREVDERIVQMTFNNAEFEKGVSHSLSTLEKLKRALDFKHRPTGLEDFGRAIGTIEKNLNPIAKNVDHIADRFSALGIIGDQVLRNLTNRVTSFVESTVKSATIEPLTSGFKEYETQMKSVQTILANTGMEGVLGVKRVNKALDELNEYADKTIYNFTEMTNNIGRFTAAGVDLDTSVNAIKGVSNLAAMSGSTSEQNARAMYNLSQALSSGTLKLMDWNSVVNAGMGGQVFQNQLIQAAAVLDGMGDKVDEWKKKNIDAFGSFRDSLSKGWITKDVLNEALSAFTYDVTEGTEEYTKALKELTDKGYTEKAAKDILKLGKQATEAATKVRTFTQLIDTLKEALGSGWAQSWRIIFGDFLEATELFTGISDLLGGIIDASSKARNNILQAWADSDIGGRKEAIEAFKELIYDLVLVLKPVGQAFDNVFGKFDVKRLQDLTVGFHNFAKSLHPSKEGFYAIQNIATKVFEIIKAGLKIIGTGFKVAANLGKPLLYLANALLVSFSNLLDAVANNNALATFVDFIERLGRVVSGGLIAGVALVVKGISTLTSLFNRTKTTSFGKSLNGLNKDTKKLSDRFPLINKAVETFSKIIKGARDGVHAFSNIIASGLTFIIRGIDYISKLPILTTAINGVKNILGALWVVLTGIGKTISSIFKGIGSIDFSNISNPLEVVGRIVTTVINNIINGIKNIVTTLETKSSVFKAFTGMIRSIVTALKDGITTIKEFFTSFKSSGANFEGGSSGIRALADALRDFISVVTPAKAAALAITLVMLAMSLTFIKVGSQIGATLKSVSGLFNTATKALNGFVSVQANKVIQAAEAILMVAAAIAIVAGIKDEDMWRAFAAVTMLSLVMGVIAIIYAKVQKFPNITGDGSNTIVNLGGLALMVLELAAALGLLNHAMMSMKNIDLKEISTNLSAVLILLGSFVAISFIFDRKKVGFSKGTIGILVLSTSLMVLTKAVKQLEGLDPETAVNAVLGLTPLLVALAGVAYATKGIGITTGVGLILTAKAIEYLSPQIKLLYDTMKTKIPAILELIEMYKDGFTSLVAGAALLIGVSGYFAKALKNLGAAVVGMAAGVYILVLAFEKLTEITNSGKDFINAEIVLAALMGLVGIWVIIASKVPEKSAILRVGAAIVLMASSLLIINLAFAQLISMSGEAGVWVATAILGGILVALTFMMKVASQAGAVKGAFELMAAMMLGLTMLTAELIALSFIDPKDLIVPIIALGTLMFAMGNILKSMQNISRFNGKNVIAVIIIIAGIGGICAALSHLAQYNWANLLGAAVSMGIVFLAFNTVINNLTKLNNYASAQAAIPIMGACVIGLIGISYALSMLAQFNWQDLLGNAVIISGVMLAISMMTVMIGKSAPNFNKGMGALAALGGLMGMLLVVTGSLYLLTQLDMEKMWSSLKALGLVILVSAGLVALFSKIKSEALEGAAFAAAGIGLFILLIITEFALIGAAIKGFDNGNAISESLNYFADTIGTAIGHFVGSFGEAASASLPQIAKNFSEFGENIGGFFEATSKIDDASTRGVLNLAKAMALIGAASFLDALTRIITLGSSPIDQFKEAMPKLAEGIRAYTDVINGISDKSNRKIDTSGIEESANALKAIAEASKEIPNEGGWLATFFGENSPESFGNQLGALGKGIAEFAKNVSGIETESVDPALNALTKIVSVARNIPNAGGAIADFFGENNIDDFAKRLEAVAVGMVTFTMIVSTITDEQWTSAEKSMRSFKSIVDVAKQIPNAGGAIVAIVGDNDISRFGADLGTLGLGLRTFATLTGSIDESKWSNAERSIDVLTNIVNAAKEIPNSGASFLSGLVGDNKISDFGQQLADFVEPFVTFVNGINNVDTTNMDRVTTSIGGLTTTLDGLTDINIFDLQMLLPMIGDELGKIIDVFSKAIDENEEGIVGLIDKIVELMLKSADTHNKEFRDQGIEFASAMGDGIKVSTHNLANDITTLVKNAFENSRDELLKTVNEIGGEVGQEYVNGIVGPEGIDPEEIVNPGDSSDKIEESSTTLTTNAFENTAENVKKAVGSMGASVGDWWTGVVANGIDASVITDKVASVGDTIGKLWNGEITPQSIWDNITGTANEIVSGSGLAKMLGIGDLFPNMTGIFPEGSDVESMKDMFGGAIDGTDGLTKSTGKLGKSVSGTSDKLTKAKDNLKTYTTYMKYSTKVQDEFTKTFGAAMSAGNGIAPIDNAKVAVAALAEQIYSDSKKVEDSVDETAETIEDRAAAVMEAFNKDYESIKSSIGDSIDLFKNFYSENSETTKPSTLLRNAKSQFEGYTQMVEKYRLLALKGVPVDYIQELASKGADGIGQMNSILALNNNELSEFLSLWEKTSDMSDNFAAQVMSAKAISVSIKNLKKEAAGHKAVNKELREKYSLFKKYYKDLVDKGGDPAENGDLIDFFKDLNESAEKANVTMEELEDSLNNVSGANAAATLQLISDYTQASTVLDKYNSTLSQTEVSMESLIESQLGGFEEFTKKTGISSEKMLSNLRSQVKGLNQWSKELGALAGRGLSNEIVNELANLGPEGYEQVHAFYKMTEDQINEANTLWSRRAGLTQSASRMVATRMAESAVGGADAYTQALTKYAETNEEFHKAIETFSTTVTQGVTEKSSADLIMGGADAGKAFTSAMAKSIEDNKSTATSAAKSAAKASTDEAAKTVTEEGEKTINPAVKGSIKGVSKIAEKTIDEESKNTVAPAAKTAGSEVDKAFASEINYKSGETNSLHYLEGAMSPFKLGSDPLEKLKKTVREASKVIPETNRFEWKINSPSKVAEKIGSFYVEGLIVGVDKMQNKLINAVETTSQIFMDGMSKIGNVDINARPIVHNEDGSYSTTETTFQEKWVGDEETGHYRIGHFATIRNDGSRLTDEELNDYIEKVLGSDDPFGVDAQMDNLLYLISDKISNGDYITDANIDQAFMEAKAWDEDMHNLQDSMYGDRAATSYEGGIQITQSFVKGLIQGLQIAEPDVNDASYRTAMSIANMTRMAVEAADRLGDGPSLHPSISPVVNLSAAQNGFNTLGAIFNDKSFKVGFNAPIDRQITINSDSNKVANAIGANRYNDAKLIDEVSGLRDDVNSLNGRLEDLQVVMDTGTLVGTIAPKMDRELGTIYRRNNR